jgi:D-glycero-D-manno-heptose 1,7-bisphosphate phosphatase
MVLVNGRPFLFYLLDQLSAQGIKKFVLLTGYLGHLISDYFGDGSALGWSITYSHRPVEWETADRVSAVIEDLDDQFILLYSDNFAQFRLHDLIAENSKNKSAITLSTVNKVPGNIEIGLDGIVLNYDESRTGSRSQFVEIGYALIDKKRIIGYLTSVRETSFSSVIHQLAKDKQVSAIVIKTGYQSISDPLRLKATESHLVHKKILLVDRDGTLNVKPKNGEYVNTKADFHWIPSSRTAIRELGEAGFSFIVITNQAGVALGKTLITDLDEIHEQLRADFDADGLKLLDIYACTEHWNSASELRKPKPGMFYLAANDHNFRLDHAIYVGDDLRDVYAAKNAGCRSLLISTSSSEFPDQIIEQVAESFRHHVPTVIEKYLCAENFVS